MVKIINSHQNPLIKNTKKLHQKKYRFLEKKFIIEGFHLVDEALKLNKIEIIFILDTHYQNYQNFNNVIIVNQDILNIISQNESPQPIIGVCNFFDQENQINDDTVILLDNIQDPGNLGTILRTCVAFNIKKIYLSSNCVDIYNYKVIQASQGAIFHINIIYTNLVEIINKLKLHNFKIYGTRLQPSSTNLKDLHFNKKRAIIFGNEGQGINKELWSMIDDNFIIKMNNKIESLNVAIALSIVLFYVQ